jgi:maltooligosyltrehalose synthase
MKLHLIARALDLRARRPEAFGAGGYDAIEAGPDCCAFTRGDGEVLVVVVLRAGGEDAAIEAPAGRWGDVLGDGDERDLTAAVTAAELAGSHGLALLERM